MVPLPNAAGTNNFIRQPDITDDNDRFSGRFDLRASANDNFFARYSYNKRFRFVPGWFGGLLDGSSTSAWGRNDLNSQSAVFGWTKILGPAVVNEFRLAWSQGRSDGYQDPKGEDGMSADRVHRRARREPHRRHHRRRHSGLHPHGVAELHAEVSAHRSDAVHRHDVVAARRAPVQVRHRDHGADDRTTTSTCQPRAGTRYSATTCSRAARSPISCSAMPRRCSCRTFTKCTSVSTPTRSSSRTTFAPSERLTLNLGLRYDFVTPQMDAENRVANFDPATGQLYYATDGSIEDRALVKPDRNNFGPRLGIVYKANTADGHPRRLRHLLQPGRADGIGRSAVAEPAGTPQHQHHRTCRIDDTRVHSEQWLSTELPRRLEHQLPHAAAPNGAARRQELACSTSSPSASNGRSRRTSSPRPTSSGRSDATSRCCET